MIVLAAIAAVECAAAEHSGFSRSFSAFAIDPKSMERKAVTPAMTTVSQA
jgi:hypothetical protein